MEQKNALMGLYTETPLHPGTGQSAGIIDLPVQRERHTGYPFIPATSLKGSLRSVAVDADWVDQVFGPKDGELHAGALTITDGKLLAFPVRSLQEVFLWVTCPLILGRLKRDLLLIGDSVTIPEANPQERKAIISGNFLNIGERLILEDLLLLVQSQGAAKLSNELARLFLPPDSNGIKYRERFQTHLVVVSDKDFSYLVTHTTQVTARIKLTSVKTTGKIEGEKGNLWYEETLPADCLFYSLLMAFPSRKPADGNSLNANKVLSLATKDFGLEYLQVGGNETVGQGWCRLHFTQGGGS